MTVPHHRSTPRQVVLDRGAHWRAKLGFVLLASEQTIEDEVMAMRPTGVGTHFSRAPMSNSITVANLDAMADTLADAASVIIPEAGVDVVCYACTSGSIVLGEDRVIRELNRGAPKAKATTLVTGVVEALRVLNTRRIVVGTPYLDEINALERDFLQAKDFEVLAIEGLNIRHDSDMVRVPPDYLVEFAKELDRPDADAIFLSCGALRTLQVVETIEHARGKPVIASNQAMMWHCLRLAGIEDRLSGYGALFQAA
ncbi:MAG: arylmalonate decarboxylase [Gammaproteobacteria bacterium]|nr:arylmalonate decarboxylase [Gammaproteobacteria bacterium]NIR82024.1 arylmalonate decarboxylase [Gammaproteobacteria bacterium]NIR89252.1 arylmalonate decarboxylase [Gammaproteobacteria bacterium]NIU03134.1 arylmalonate decarboxylase [Gammaproteobacteria bacterium]NIV50650.1 arylmalonate decarboxylase [Gammaproteobacteria bacterium]